MTPWIPGLVGDDDGACNMSIAQLVMEKWSVMSKNQFSTVLSPVHSTKLVSPASRCIALCITALSEHRIVNRPLVKNTVVPYTL